jgi:hypothetical protein
MHQGPTILDLKPRGITPAFLRALRQGEWSSQRAHEEILAFPDFQLGLLDEAIQRGEQGHRDYSECSELEFALQHHLSAEDHQLLFDPAIPSFRIDRPLVDRYSVKHFVANIRLAMRAPEGVVMFAPPNHPERWRLRLLASTGAAIVGTSIAAQRRAEVMPMVALRRLGALHDVKGASRRMLAERLCAVPAFLSVLDRASDNYFQILPLDAPWDQVQKRLLYLSLASDLIETAQQEESFRRLE